MKKLIYLLSLVALCSCHADKKETQNAYFDVKGYFEKEAIRLNKLNPTVLKTVVENGKTEQKKVKIADWSEELKSFLEGDINKAAWQNQFAIKKQNGLTIYKNVNDKITVKKLGVSIVNKKIDYIGIFLENENMLYNSVDTLSYLPGISYEIRKTQKVVLSKEKSYRIFVEFPR